MAVYITRQPESIRIPNGGAARFTVEAEGASSYAWQYSADGGASWAAISGWSGTTGQNTATLTIDPAGSWHEERVYRCLIKDASGNQATTDVVGITLTARCVILRQPADVVASVGDTVTFTVEAENCSYYAWQHSVDGGASWVSIKAEGAGGESYSPSSSVTVTVTQENRSDQYRCELRDSSWTAAYTNAVEVMSEVKRAFAYTGEVVSFTIPVSGIYRLTVVGANGGARDNLSTARAYGGRSVGCREFKRGDVIYVCCGQAGGFEGRAAYNGGGAGIVPTFGAESWRVPSGSGGGATHIATASGTLANLTDDQVLIVAGGSGGDSAGGSTYHMYAVSGGAGGGISGVKGSHYGGNGTTAEPGTQESGFAKGAGQSASWTAEWERNPIVTGGGGGGYWGGYAGNGAGAAGAGGSGYIGGVPEIAYKGVTYTPTTEQNYNTEGTDGYAVIELVVKTTLPVTFNGTVLEAIKFNGVEVAGLIVDGVRLFFRSMKRRIAAWCTSMKPARCWAAST